MSLWGMGTSVPLPHVRPQQPLLRSASSGPKQPSCSLSPAVRFHPSPSFLASPQPKTSPCHTAGNCGGSWWVSHQGRLFRVNWHQFPCWCPSSSGCHDVLPSGANTFLLIREQGQMSQFTDFSSECFLQDELGSHKLVVLPNFSSVLSNLSYPSLLSWQ